MVDNLYCVCRTCLLVLYTIHWLDQHDQCHETLAQVLHCEYKYWANLGLVNWTKPPPKSMYSALWHCFYSLQKTLLMAHGTQFAMNFTKYLVYTAGFTHIHTHTHTHTNTHAHARTLAHPPPTHTHTRVCTAGFCARYSHTPSQQARTRRERAP